MNARSVLECGGPPPLSPTPDVACPAKNARGLAESRTCRAWLLCLLLSAFCFRAWGQYSVDWSTIDGGGGTSTGGVYTITGTIGQPDASQQPMTGGSYSLGGGFWSLLAIQTSGAPYLWVMRTATNTVVVWWAVSDSNWQLQAATNLVTAGSVWTAYAYVTNGANCVYIESPPIGKKFYRLKQQ